MNPTQTLTVYMKKQEKCQTFAADAKEPISYKTMINTWLSHTIGADLMINRYQKGK